ncbi:MAG: POTRA domain-containing protein [Vicinamibacterales bacterium]
MRHLLLGVQLTLLAGTAAAAPPPAPRVPQEAQAAPATSAAASYVGKPVEQVRAFIDGQPTVDVGITDLLETRVGRPLSMADVRESIGHLYSLGRFQDVQVDATATAAGGVSVRYDLVPLRSVEAVEFTGTLGLDRGLLRRTVADRYGARPPIARGADAARTLEALYADHGYLGARVRVLPLSAVGQGRTVLTFEVEAGPQAKIAEVTIDGDVRTTRASFERQLQIERGSPYEPPVLQRKLDEFTQKLRRRGFYEANAGHRAVISEDRTAVTLVLAVRSGPVVTVKYEGDPLPADRLKELVPVERDSSVAEDLLEDSVVAIRAYLRQQGYWKADASWRREESTDALAIVFQIKKGLRYVVAEPVALTGNQALTADELRTMIALKPGDIFLESGLSLAAAAITELYRQRGFAAAAVKYSAVETDPRKPDEGVIRPSITVSEGPRTVVGTVRVTGNAALTEGKLRPLLKLAEGQPYYAPQLNADRDALIVDYLNNGFSTADVVVTPAFSGDRTRADLTYAVQEGPQTIVDHILIVGNRHTDPRVILREMKLKPGAPLGREDRDESQRAVSALGLFRRVRITELRHGSGARQDVLVTVDEAPMTTISYGGGLEANQQLRATGPAGEAREQLEFAPRGFFNIGRRNVGGRNRTVDLYTRVSLRPQDAPDDPTRDGSGLGFSEYRVVGTMRQPRALFSSDVVVTAAFEQGVRTSFNFARKGVNADMLRRLTPSMRVSARYTFSTTRTFDERLDEEEQATIDRIFPQVRLSTFSGALARDTRDNVIDPRKGAFLSAEGTLAMRALGGQVGFSKTYLQGYWFRQLPGRRPIVFATRGAIGLADGFERVVNKVDAAGNPIGDPACAASPGDTCVIEDLPASERFFAGGDTTIRGFALDTVGTPSTISVNGFPRGGNAVLILNAELRVPVWREFGAAFFADGGNVFDRVTNMDLGELRGALGVGLRYRSPLGPVRLDVGFKLNRRELGGSLEPRAVWHLSIGQAF